MDPADALEVAHGKRAAELVRKQDNLLRQAEDADPDDPFTHGLRERYNILVTEHQHVLTQINDLDHNEQPQQPNVTRKDLALLDSLPHLALNLHRMPHELQNTALRPDQTSHHHRPRNRPRPHRAHPARRQHPRHHQHRRSHTTDRTTQRTHRQASECAGQRWCDCYWCPRQEHQRMGTGLTSDFRLDAWSCRPVSCCSGQVALACGAALLLCRWCHSTTSRITATCCRPRRSASVPSTRLISKTTSTASCCCWRRVRCLEPEVVHAAI